MKKIYLLTIFCLLLILVSNAQNGKEGTGLAVKYIGQLLDETTQQPLTFAHVAVLGSKTGAVTNEEGNFTITCNQLDDNDTLSFYFVGYQTKKISVSRFLSNSTVFLKSETFSLKEFFVFSDNKNAEEIVRSVLENKATNYKQICSKNQLFSRNRYIANIDHIDIQFKKNSFEQLSEKMTKLIEKKVPKHSISYTDFLGNAYWSENPKDTLKIEPIKIVSLKDKNLADINQLEEIFEKIFVNTKEKEYWKVKSGIFGGKVDVEEGFKENKDSLVKHHNEEWMNYYYVTRLDEMFDNLFINKKKWEFLYHTNRYNYELVFGTLINGEKVYVIDFKPKNNGEYVGRLYVAIETYALVKASYSYAKGKTGTNIKIFGIGYTENVYDVTIYFEKREDTYQLKYYTRNTGSKMFFNRNLSLLKKKKRFLVDKTVNEIKVKLNLKITELSSYEILVISNKKIAKKEFNSFKQKPNFKTDYVDKFSDDLWRNYTIIEPSKQMRDYKKID